MGIKIEVIRGWIAAGLSNEEIQVLIDGMTVCLDCEEYRASARERQRRCRDKSRDSHTKKGLPHTPSKEITILPLEPLIQISGKEQKGVVARSERASRIPEPFVVTEEMLRWAHSEGLDEAEVGRRTDNFVDYWRGVPGQKGRKLDWMATWRNAMRNGYGRPQGGGKRTIHDAAKDLYRRAVLEEGRSSSGGIADRVLRRLGKS